eukprot:jgi/Tetstr1/438131/TSEL_002857.t1
MAAERGKTARDRWSEIQLSLHHKETKLLSTKILMRGRSGSDSDEPKPSPTAEKLQGNKLLMAIISSTAKELASHQQAVEFQKQWRNKNRQEDQAALGKDAPHADEHTGGDADAEPRRKMGAMDQKINELKKEMSKDTMRAVLTLQMYWRQKLARVRETKAKRQENKLTLQRMKRESFLRMRGVSTGNP